MVHTYLRLLECIYEKSSTEESHLVEKTLLWIRCAGVQHGSIYLKLPRAGQGLRSLPAIAHVQMLICRGVSFVQKIQAEGPENHP